MPDKYCISVDIGGTFTDLVTLSPRRPPVHAKSLSTPSQPTDGVFSVLTKSAESIGIPLKAMLEDCPLLIVGTTIATNSLLERKGAVVGLLCTSGFRDDLAIRRGFIPRERDFRAAFPTDLVPRRRRLGVRERVNKHGSVVEPLSVEDVDSAVATLKNANVDSVAICLFNSFLNPVHEKALKVLVTERMPQAYVTASADILPVMGEYGRVATTTADAYVGPRTIGWLRSLEQRLQDSGFHGSVYIMQNNGGVIDTDQARQCPATLVLSGPAAGAAGARAVLKERDEPVTILFDMGGTSTDVTILRNGRALVAEETNVGGYDIMLPAIDVHTVAAGGGAIAWRDAGGLLRVGPMSAGAVPGPAALGRGGKEPTVTDANLVLGRLDPDNYAGGEIPLYPDLARRSFQSLSLALERTVEAAALGVAQLAEEAMAQAIFAFSLRKGIDARSSFLVSAGGAGGLHAAAIARILGVKRILLPYSAPVFCAMGMLNADLRRDFVRTIFRSMSETSAGRIRELLEDLQAEARSQLESSPWPMEPSFEYAVALQYRGQMSSIEIEVPVLTTEALEQLATHFHQRHEELYGHSNPGTPIQIARLRVTVAGRFDIPSSVSEDGSFDEPPPTGSRFVTFSNGASLDSAVYRLETLTSHWNTRGPAVVEGAATTILVPPGAMAKCDAQHNILITLDGESR